MKKTYILSLHLLAALVTILALAFIVTFASPAFAGDIVDHPDKLTFDELKYQPPKPQDYRHTLKCGATAYVAENPELPTVEMTIIVRAGSIYDRTEKAGLSGMVGYLMRNGGVEGMAVRDLDEKIAFLKLKSLGTKIDSLTPEQKKYLSSWEIGT